VGEHPVDALDLGLERRGRAHPQSLRARSQRLRLVVGDRSRDAWLPEWAPGAPVRSLADVIAFDEAHAAEEMPFFGQELFFRAQATRGLDAPAYRKALARCRRLSRTEGSTG
jgi:hypothetical protein